MLIWLLLLHIGYAHCQSPWHHHNCADGRTAMVHLFEWKWKDIEAECVRFLGPRGYCGVQVSPPQEHIVTDYHNWWQRYQPVSYKLESRSGSRQEFISMVETCNNNNVRIYVDAIINHMTGVGRTSETDPGSDGSDYDADEGHYPEVPYTMEDFNTCDGCDGCCCVNDWTNLVMVRNCRLIGLIDLNPKVPHVTDMIAGYMNDLIDIGVAGFRIDAAKHMWPDDLEMIFNRLNDLNSRWFPAGSKSYIAMEVIDLNQHNEVNVHEYKHIGQVTEFRYCSKIADAAGHPPNIRFIWDQAWNMIEPENAFVFVDNHDNQRGHGGGGEVLTFRSPGPYTMAVALTLGWAHNEKGYGHPRVMSSFDFGDDTERGPPADSDGNTDDVVVTEGGCEGEWVCEHRWPAIAGMAGWAKATGGGDVSNEHVSGNVYAFSRGGRGFVAYNNPGTTLQTGLPPGDYCNVIQGCATSSGCAGQTVTVGGDGTAYINIEGGDPILAIHVEAMAGSNQCVDVGVLPSPGPTTEPTTRATPEPTEAPTTEEPPTESTDGPTTEEPTGPTEEPTEPTGEPEPTDEPGPGDWKRTVVYMYAVTADGQDVSIRGGVAHSQRPGCTNDAETSDCAIDIETQSLGTDGHYGKYDAWREGDTKLDFYGAQEGQGDWQGQTAVGTPLAWTTDDTSHPGYQPDNEWGWQHWKVEFLMDCSQTEDGWFDVRGVGRTNGGVLVEEAIQQGSCDGDAGGAAPYSSTSHLARCGYRNRFAWGENGCQIDAMQ